MKKTRLCKKKHGEGTVEVTMNKNNLEYIMNIVAYIKT